MTEQELKLLKSGDQLVLVKYIANIPAQVGDMVKYVFTEGAVIGVVVGGYFTKRHMDYFSLPTAAHLLKEMPVGTPLRALRKTTSSGLMTLSTGERVILRGVDDTNHDDPWTLAVSDEPAMHTWHWFKAEDFEVVKES